MKEKINWQKELIKAENLMINFQKIFLNKEQKLYAESIWYMYSRWREIRGFEKDYPLENKGQMQSSFKDFEKKIK